MGRRLVMNVRSLDRRMGGVERFTHEMLRFWPGEIRQVRPVGKAAGWRGHLWEQVILPLKLSENELLWSPANTGPISLSAQILSLADVSPIENPRWYSPTFRTWYRIFLPALTRRVQAVMTISNFSRERILRALSISPGRVHVVPCGVDRRKFKPITRGEADNVRKEFGIKPEFILFVGSANPRKNLGRLLNAWDHFRNGYPAHQLVLVGSNSGNFAREALPPLPSSVIRLGYVEEARLPSLYAAAAALVLPSLHEGFGLPALEAMACGTPVVASNQAALPEVVGDAAILVDPYDVSSIASGLERLVSNPDLRTALIERGLERSAKFPWERSVEAARDVIEQYL